MNGLITYLKKQFVADPSNEHLPSVEEMDAFLPPDWCNIQLAMARNHHDPEPLLAELGPKKTELERRIQLVEQEEIRVRAEMDAQEQINGGRMTLREKLLLAGFIVTLPISLPIAFGIAMDKAAKGSEMMRINLRFLERMEAELVRSSLRKTRIAAIDKELDEQ